VADNPNAQTRAKLPGRGFSKNDMALLERIARDDLTPHGFRSTFPDWAAERTDFPREVVEMALANTIENKVEAAYRRGDLFRKRRQLMGGVGGVLLHDARPG
jgi:integrase